MRVAVALGKLGVVGDQTLGERGVAVASRQQHETVPLRLVNDRNKRGRSGVEA